MFPDRVDDVSETVKYAVRNNIRFTTRSGGHSAAGYCLNSEGIVLDIRSLNSRSLDRNDGRLRLGMGNIWRDVYDYLETSQIGRIPIGGGCPGVGVAGFLLGNGFSFVSRSYGLGSDNMLSLTVVMADGEIKTINQTDDADLFWAMRGAGGGNFAIAVEAELQTRETRTESMMMGQVVFPFYRIEEILAFYNDWVETEEFPKEMAIYGMVRHIPDPRHAGRPLLSLAFTPVFNGTFSDGVDCLKPLLALDPIRVSLNDMTLPEWEDYIGEGTQVEGRSAYIRSVVTPARSMSTEVARVFKEHMSRAPSKDTFVVWTHLGGAVESEFGNDDGAFAFRNSRFVPEVKSIWESNKPQDMRRNVEWAYDFFEDLTAASGATGAYVNYIDPLLVDWQEKYYGGNYERLLNIQKKVDPEGVFAFQQGIGSQFLPEGRVGKWLDLSPLQRTFE